LVDEKFQTSRKVVKSFQRILAEPPKTLNVLNEMLTTGILVALIPELKGIVNLIQYDEYHVYPVDKHSLRTVQTLKGFLNGESEAQDAFYEGLFSEIDRPDLLLWAALLHDTGKAVDVQNHCTQGAQIVRQVFERMGFPEPDIERVSFLVEKHLFLIHMATRRDISDERVVIECAQEFPDAELLKMLYLLTVADSKATGPKAWGEWTDTLLRELFVKILHVIEKGELASQEAADLVEAKKADVFERAVDLPRERLEEVFDQMSPRYLYYTKAKDIIRHIELYDRIGEEAFLLEAQAKSRSKYRMVTLCAKDFPGLFSKIAGVFTLNNLDILSAQIYTWRNHVALDIFRVKAPPDRLHENEVWARVRRNLKSALKGTLALESALGKKVRAYRSLQKKISIQPDRVVIDNEASHFFTVIEVYTHDFPGLLYRVTDALFRCKLDIWVAKIGTKADQVVDVFYVRDFDGQKVVDPREVEAIKETITDVLSEDPLSSPAQ
jgi:[protein-PII] uridylyltransferase